MPGGAKLGSREDRPHLALRCLSSRRMSSSDPSINGRHSSNTACHGFQEGDPLVALVPKLEDADRFQVLHPPFHLCDPLLEILCPDVREDNGMGLLVAELLQ